MRKTFVAGVLIAAVLVGLRLAAQTETPDKGVPAADFKKLQTLLPTVSGWTMGRPGGSNRDVPFPISEASARYVNGTMVVAVNIMDPAYEPMWMGPISTAFAMGGVDGQKVVTVAGVKTLEDRISTASRRCTALSRRWT